jgi:hypothetical protein
MDRIAPQPHTAAQPGLRGHSWDPENDLLKKFLVVRAIPGGGWLGMASFHTDPEAQAYIRDADGTHTYRVDTQF